MNRQNDVPFNLAAKPRGAAPAYKPQLPGRVPQNFIEAMKLIQGKPGDNPNIRTSDMAAKTLPVRSRAVQPSLCKWKSSFKPLVGGDTSEDKGTDGSERSELYDPYSAVLSDSELKMSDSSHCPSDQEKKLGDSLSPAGQLFSPETRPCENQGFSSGQRLHDRQTYSPNTKSLDRPGYCSIGRHLDHRVCSSDQIIPGSSTQRFPTSYGGQRTNEEERITVPEFRRERTTAVRLTPPRLHRDYRHQQGHVETGQDHIKLSPEMTRNSSKIIIMDKNPITCDLCEVELTNGQELEDHLDSKRHWDTLELIQQQNNYDDLAIAFLQEVMLYKCRQCSRAIEDSALQALQENDHMTKVEMFHCATCDVFVSTSASSVQSHITSKDHLSKTKEFELQQRCACLSKAETIMKELKPQFEHFTKGGSPFE
ncbi:uncharacterized protein LOC113172483 [Anabas testudineus]|uniref:DBIRD complex subunit ZNF326 n=1 Tax=Anabas testudineus TaxID=64144 RepID=A0A3Q1J501_ANATE|nr:uncharacterized protein LOC113172483 [Anabas testudineus]